MQLRSLFVARYWRYRWWRVGTWARLTLSRQTRDFWRITFRSHPELTNARHYADRPELGHALMAYQTMSGYYNDHVRGGFMTEAQAKSIYHGE